MCTHVCVCVHRRCVLCLHSSYLHPFVGCAKASLKLIQRHLGGDTMQAVLHRSAWHLADLRSQVSATDWANLRFIFGSLLCGCMSLVSEAFGLERQSLEAPAREALGCNSARPPTRVPGWTTTGLPVSEGCPSGEICALQGLTFVLQRISIMFLKAKGHFQFASV